MAEAITPEVHVNPLKSPTKSKVKESIAGVVTDPSRLVTIQMYFHLPPGVRLSQQSQVENLFPPH